MISAIENGAFDDLYSLVFVQLYGNRLTTLSPNLFINVPRSMTMVLSFPRYANQWYCSSLCWLKHEQQHGTYRGGDPICKYGIDWNSLQCGDNGESDFLNCVPLLKHEFRFKYVDAKL